ncbi:MAG: hypothetical protein ACXVXE_14235 [Nocardioidaceae bacterium]
MRLIRVTAIWTAAGLVNLVGTLVVLLMLAQGAKHIGESFCGEPGRLPPDVNGYGGPSLVSPVTFRCDYSPQHPAVVVTDWGPLIATVVAGLVTLAGAGAVSWAAHRLARAATAAQGVSQ